jgi:ribosome maturation protein SDO1
MFRDVATIVSEKSVNPETDRPYTISMIQNAMKDIHYSVNLTKNAKQQALDVIRKLRKVMPIARVMMSLKITLAVPCELIFSSPSCYEFSCPRSPA